MLLSYSTPAACQKEYGDVQLSIESESFSSTTFKPAKSFALQIGLNCSDFIFLWNIMTTKHRSIHREVDYKVCDDFDKQAYILTKLILMIEV